MQAVARLLDIDAVPSLLLQIIHQSAAAAQCCQSL